MPRTPADTAAAALRHLRSADPVLARVIRRAGPFTLKLERDRFRMLVRSIIAQQISTAAANSIRRRLEERIAPARATPEVLAALSTDELRACGLSGQKAGYLHDLAAKVASGTVRIRQLARLDDDAVISELIQVRGIGEWTAQMVLIFSLGRLDVLPHADLGIRSAMRRLYGLAELPNKSEAHRIAAPWRPYASVASWYLWRSLEQVDEPDPA